MTERSSTVHCSFCGQSNHEVGLIVAGISAFICGHCIALCLQTLSDKARSINETLPIKETHNG